jgi:hypothetical protein
MLMPGDDAQLITSLYRTRDSHKNGMTRFKEQRLTLDPFTNSLLTHTISVIFLSAQQCTLSYTFVFMITRLLSSIKKHTRAHID